MQPQLLPIISIVGTTSTGKSEAVFLLAEYVLEKKLTTGVVIISADSRQVYENLEVLTGADIPDGYVTGAADFDQSTLADESAQKIPEKYFYKITERGTIEVYGISMLSPFEEWSVGRFSEYAQTIITCAQDAGKAVFVVGGTGLYQQHVLTTDPRLNIPPNPELREKLQTLSVQELQHELQSMNADYFEQMNNSDRHNPRRLQRAIEVERALQYLQETDPETFDLFLEQQHAARQNEVVETQKHVYIGLQVSLDTLHQKITKRVMDRFEHGAVQEVAQLLANAQEKNTPLSPQAATTLGFAEIQRFLEHESTAEKCIELWVQADFGYSKRQLTWWKKYGSVSWINREATDWYTQLLEVFKTKI